MKNQTFGLIVTTRSFFPSHLALDAKKQMIRMLTERGFDYITVSDNDTEWGAVRSYEEALKCAELFRRNRDKISGIIIVLPNFGDETGVADAVQLAGLNVPILVQACSDETDKLQLSNRRDAFCGKISLCNNFYQRGIKFTNTSSHTCRIDSDEFAGDLEKFAAVCRVVAGLKNARIAAIGARPAPFHTVRFSEKILQKHQITVETADMSEIIFAAKNMKNSPRVEAKAQEIRHYGSIIPGISNEKIEKQAKLSLALEDFVEKSHCVASAVQCWDSIQENYGCATCLAMSMMGERGKPSACEMDVTGAVTMYALLIASGRPSAYMDWNNNIDDDADGCICLHCSNFPKNFFEKDDIEIGNLDVLATTIDEEKCFGACKGQVNEGPMTFAKISTDDARGTLKMYIGEGRFLAEKVDTKGGVARCHVDGLQELMRYVCDNGFEHHVAFGRGNVADILEEALGKYMDVEVYRHRG